MEEDAEAIFIIGCHRKGAACKKGARECGRRGRLKTASRRHSQAGGRGGPVTEAPLLQDLPRVHGGNKHRLRQRSGGPRVALRDSGLESLYPATPVVSPTTLQVVSPTSPLTPSLQHLLGLIDSRGTWTLVRESSGPCTGLPWDWKAGGWKRGLPGPVEKGRRGLAEVLVGSRGEVAAPAKKPEETGFTRPEVLGGRKENRARQRPGRAAGLPLAEAARLEPVLPLPSFQIPD